FNRKRGLKTRATKVLLMITLSMYFLSAAYWAYRFAETIDRIQTYLANHQDPPTSSPVTRWLVLFNALVLVNMSLDCC
ncbi:hypothetical protein C8R43DRAFT_896168, partial [Mycena crocata]